ncbi:MAG: carbohydrate ABC transporter permease [Propionibacteriaceae bacterium]|jgi:glucose/mannose transport system permease protein|nr:carbohydrate ABC transporter permease [Propionibacteriaceae bacterium]
MSESVTLYDPAPAVRRRRGKGFNWARLLRYLLLLFFLIVVLIPVYVLVITSFKENATASQAWFLPENWSLENWKSAWMGFKGLPAIGPALGRTVGMVVPAAIISSFLGSMNGFVLSRWRIPYSNVIFTLILFGMFIPYQSVMVPLYQIVHGLGLPPGTPSLIFLHVVYGIPITTLIFRNYYESIPNELIESSRVDGAGMLKTYSRVVLPLSVPSFVVVLIWQFTSAWNDFLFALFFSSGNNGPVTLALYSMAGGSMLQDYGASMAAAIMSSLPTLLVYILLGKYFVGGLMSGSVKG